MVCTTRLNSTLTSSLISSANTMVVGKENSSLSPLMMKVLATMLPKK